MLDYPNENSPRLQLPLLCWDVYTLGALHRHAPSFKTDLDILQSYNKQFHWQIDLQNTLLHPYQTLILTDRQQKILWVNEGFEPMTGYSSTHATGRTPAFLQGPKTDSAVKDRLRKNLADNKKFTGSIVNYRADGSEYVCLLQIFPLISKELTATHFLALESEA